MQACEYITIEEIQNIMSCDEAQDIYLKNKRVFCSQPDQKYEDISFNETAQIIVKFSEP